MEKLNINSEYSAQSSIGKPNPFVVKAIEYIKKNKMIDFSVDVKIADQGCGKLRHFKILKKFFKKICLVDTKSQLNKKQRIFRKDKITIREYITTGLAHFSLQNLWQSSNYRILLQFGFNFANSLNHAIPIKFCASPVTSLNHKNNDITILSNLEFNATELNLDIVFNICVFDVVFPETREEMISAAMNNLKQNGLFIVIVPRNDQSILKRCKDDCQYYDGHIFKRSSITTFYRNFRKTETIIDKLVNRGFSMKVDMSRYRHICLIMQKN